MGVRGEGAAARLQEAMEDAKLTRGIKFLKNKK